MGDLANIKSIDPANETLVRDGSHVKKQSKSEKGWLGRQLQWLFGNTNECNVLKCLTKAIKNQKPLRADDFDGFYTVKKELSTHHRGVLGWVADVILLRGTLTRCLKTFDKEAHNRLKELFYGTDKIPKEMSDAEVDSHRELMRGLYQGEDYQQKCEGFEKMLNSQFNLGDLKVIERYKEMATAGFPIASWRLSQIYSQGLMGQDPDTSKADHYSIRHQASQWDPPMEMTEFYSFFKPLVVGDSKKDVPNGELEGLYMVFSGQKSETLNKDFFETFENWLRLEHGFKDSQIVAQYEHMSRHNLQGADWRLAQIRLTHQLGQ